MKRDRFMHISRNLHFSSNSGQRAKSDRAWKLRPVIDSLQATFQSGYKPPPVISFNKTMLLSLSSFNRMINPPSGNKVIYALLFPVGILHEIHVIDFATLFEVYYGKRQRDGAVGASDTKYGPAAVIRNLREVFGTAGSREKRLIKTDRFYTSPTLAMQLLTLGFYSIGTVMTNRKGFCKDFIEKRKKRPVNMEREAFTVADNKLISIIRAVCWWDNRPVHLLAAGGSVEQDRVVRREKNGGQAEEACPRVSKDYQTFMGGVDVHDQLRLQKMRLLNSSSQVKKYYKSLFLGFLDLAIINAYIVYNTRREDDGHKTLAHVTFLKQYTLNLFSYRREIGMLAENAGYTYEKPRYSQAEFSLDEWQEGKQGRKRRQRSCKVCSVLKESSEAKGGETTFYCSTCKLRSNSKKATVTRVYLCNKVKHATNGESVSCFEIWHRHWRNGSMLLPSQRKKKIRSRTTELSVDEETKLGSDSDGGDDVDNQSKRRRYDE
ncbi:Hypothetical protein PHPALM_14408 [Phytophthora palmivora]|uniref:PiggyBac transposable element-derived protein domain-containing protein n=1 Tax=Phytophthora palmivora TaxID=4796 RepID=A0A2P4XUT1_9STRA|nr:Hypothetical protein PHPALM_14408 [Phytophthora palmivora]